MLQEHIDLLKKDLSSRIPYGLKIQVEHNWFDEERTSIVIMRGVNGNFVVYDSFTGEEEASITKVTPYLRSFSDITKDEFKYLDERGLTIGSISSIAEIKSKFDMIEIIDFCNTNHIDYRGLIQKGLALKANENTYKI